MTRRYVRRALVVAALLAALTMPLAAALPKAVGFVNDFAGILDAGTKEQLERFVHDTEQQTSAEIAVATVASLDDMTVEEYANRLFREWGIGKKGKDNGVLVLIAPFDRKVRIEVGYGLEPILPDGLAGEIIRTDFLPEFKNGQYPAGILRGTRHVAEVVQRNHIVTAGERKAFAAAGQYRPLRSGSAGDWHGGPRMVQGRLGGFVGLSFSQVHSRRRHQRELRRMGHGDELVH